mmetsp:Transcript_5727/g.14661  ORF Transcript_5727/g.14661 Transcript_5727/m.14661 type:complete len:208 (-) Transcript_5727:468-1091(-)
MHLDCLVHLNGSRHRVVHAQQHRIARPVDEHVAQGRLRLGHELGDNSSAEGSARVRADDEVSDGARLERAWGGRRTQRALELLQSLLGQVAARLHSVGTLAHECEQRAPLCVRAQLGGEAVRLREGVEALGVLEEVLLHDGLVVVQIRAPHLRPRRCLRRAPIRLECGVEVIEPPLLRGRKVGRQVRIAEYVPRAAAGDVERNRLLG